MGMDIIGLIKGLYQEYAIKPRVVAPKPVTWVPNKPRLDLAIDTAKSRPWKGMVLHHSESTNDTTETIRRFHMSYRIDHDTIASPVVNKAPGKQYIMAKNGQWYQTDQYNRYFEEKKNPCDRCFDDAWIDIAYNGVIEHPGEAVSFHWGRSLEIPGAHAGYKEFNENFIGLCVIGNYDVSDPHPDVWDFALRTVRTFMDTFGFHSEYVLGHREVYDRVGVPRKKECPGTKWNLEEFRNQL